MRITSCTQTLQTCPRRSSRVRICSSVLCPPLPRRNGGSTIAIRSRSRSAIPGTGSSSGAGAVRAHARRLLVVLLAPAPRRHRRPGGRRAGAARRRRGARRAPSSESRRLTGPGRLAARDPAGAARRRPVWCTSERTAQRARSPGAKPCSPIQRTSAPTSAERAAQPQRLDVARRLPQAAVLVEVAAHELERAVVVRVAARRRRGGRPSSSRPRAGPRRTPGPRRRRRRGSRSPPSTRARSRR